MPYAVLEPSGCGIHKDRAKLRISIYLNPDDPHYDEHYVNVPVFPEEGYPGKTVGDPPQPESQADYNTWKESLPHIWQNVPLHNHLIYPDLTASDDSIKQKIDDTLNYFFAFHKACWGAHTGFWDEWKKVPRKKGTMRDVFIKGDPQDVELCRLKAQDIVSRLPEFKIGKKVVPDINLPEGKGTIAIGPGAADLTSQTASGWTYVVKSGAADGTGTLDAVDIRIAGNATGVKIGTFSASANNLTNRDFETLGTLAAGLHEITTGIDIDVVTGDWLGAFTTAGYVDFQNSGGGGNWYKIGDQFGAGQQAFSWAANWNLAVYGTGTEAGAGLSIPIAMHHYMQMANN